MYKNRIRLFETKQTIEKSKDLKILREPFPQFSQPNFRSSLIRNRLYEVYSKTNTSFLKTLVLNLKRFLNQELSKNEFIENCSKYGIGFMLYPNQNSEVIICYFDPYLNLIVIPVYQNTIKALNDNTLDIDEYVDLLEVCITHEDTHKQQFKKYFLYSKNYKYPDSTDNTNLTTKNIAYYNQTIEAQAYGRQLGCVLRKKFPNLTVNLIFQKIWKNELKYELLDIYRDSRVSDKAFDKFFRALYNYLANREA